MSRNRNKKETHYLIRALKVIHYGDYLTELTSKRNIVAVINYLSLIKGDSHMMLQIFPSHRTTINEVVDLGWSFKDVKLAEIVRFPGTQPFIYLIKRNYGVLKALANTHSFRVGPVIVTGGFKLFPILLLKGTEGRLVELVRKYSPVKARVSITKPERLRLHELPAITRLNPELAPNLTECEIQILKKAYEMGYFEWPKKTDLDTIARAVGVSKPTVLEHIRKAVKKVIGLYLKNTL